MKELVLIRLNQNDKQTIGTLMVKENDKVLGMWPTVELPWNDNKHNISCIPTGVYQCSLYHSSHLGETLHIENVPERTGILIHIANAVQELRGCVGIGKFVKYINSDNYIDVASSKLAMRELLNIIKLDKFDHIRLTIKQI